MQRIISDLTDGCDNHRVTAQQIPFAHRWSARLNSRRQQVSWVYRLNASTLPPSTISGHGVPSGLAPKWHVDVDPPPNGPGPTPSGRARPKLPASKRMPVRELPVPLPPAAPAAFHPLAEPKAVRQHRVEALQRPEAVAAAWLERALGHAHTPPGVPHIPPAARRSLRFLNTNTTFSSSLSLLFK